ncbi:MAG: ABC transporter permease [Candidatus Thermoplasmatota archaeon]
MKRIREALYIGLFDSLPLLRDPMLLIVLSMFSFLPVMFIYLFAGAGDTFNASLVGAIVLSLAFVGLFSAQSVYFNKHWFRFQDIFVASPVSPISYAIGLSVSTLIVSLPAVILAMALLLIGVPRPIWDILAVVAVSAILWIATLMIGFAIGASTKNTRRANSLPQVLGIVLGFLPPVYYPLERLPGFLQPIALLVPTTHAAELSKYYFGLATIPDWEIVFGWLYLIAFTAVMGLIVVRRAHWVDP